MKPDLFYWIIFIGYLVYNFLSWNIFNKDNSAWYIIYGISLVVSLGLLFWMEKDGPYKKFGLFALFTLFGTGLLTSNMIIVSNASDTDGKIVLGQQTRTNWSTALFLVAGVISYIFNRVIGCAGSRDILCDDINVIIFITANLAVYQLFNMLKLKKHGFAEDSSGNTFIEVGVLTLWQIYMYFLAGGFNDSSIMSGLKSKILDNHDNTSEKTMYEYFSFISIFVIIAFIVSNEILIDNCKIDDKNKKFITTKNAINAITWNMVGTTITSIMIVATLSLRY